MLKHTSFDSRGKRMKEMRQGSSYHQGSDKPLDLGPQNKLLGICPLKGRDGLGEHKGSVWGWIILEGGGEGKQAGHGDWRKAFLSKIAGKARAWSWRASVKLEGKTTVWVQAGLSPVLASPHPKLESVLVIAFFLNSFNTTEEQSFLHFNSHSSSLQLFTLEHPSRWSETMQTEEPSTSWGSGRSEGVKTSNNVLPIPVLPIPCPLPLTVLRVNVAP